MKLGWIIGIALGTIGLLILILILTKTFSGWTFGGMIFYILIFAGGYAFLMFGKKQEREHLQEEMNKKYKFDYCWNRANIILRRMAGGQGLEWDAGFGRKSEYRSFYDGVQSRPFMSMLGYLSNTQQLVLVIYDIDRDNIARFVTNPDVDMLANHFKNFRPFARGSGTGMDDMMLRYGGRPYPIHSRRYSSSRTPISINVGDPDGITESELRGKSAKPDDDMVDNALKRLKE